MLSNLSNGLEIAKVFLNSLTNQLANKTMVAAYSKRQWKVLSQLSASCNNKWYGIQGLEGFVHGFNNQSQQQEHEIEDF